MNKIFYKIYQYLAFLILFPLAIFLWYKQLGDYKLVAWVLGLPILVAYIIPFLGVNVLGLWEFHRGCDSIKIRPYHGFVFGSATSIFGLIFYIISPNYSGILHSFAFALVCGAFVAFWNVVYDYCAIKCGFMKLNNIANIQNKSPLEIAWDYAPIYFYGLGFIYTLFLKAIQYFAISNKNGFILTMLIFYLGVLLLPSFLYSIFHYKKYGSFGLKGVKNSDFE